MKATELRIDNYVFDDENTVVKIEKICSDRYIIWSESDKFEFSKENDKQNMYVCDIINPIPLTEEILLKCKGVKSSYTSNPELIGASKKYNLGSIIIFQQNEDESVFYTCINEDMDNLIVDTLHQLQNLYFALTGQELEINL